MRFTPATVRSQASRSEVLQATGWALLAALLMAGGAGCGPSGDVPGAEDVALGSQEQNTEGIITNGIITNGIITNGVEPNSVLAAGLSTLALGSNPDFTTWFNQHLDSSSLFMEYVVRCAAPAGQTVTYTNPTTGVSYSWAGSLGLAMGWASGKTATETEQQVVTACLGAHVNKFGVHVTLLMLGTDAQGAQLTYTSTEASTYSEHEACFFGNLFADGGQVYAGSDRNTLRAAESTPRACGLSSRAYSTDCTPMVHVGDCKSYCTLDTTRMQYTSCTYNGVTYKPLTTRIRSADIYTCGDGVCQFTESCGTGNTYDNCGADCGPCPSASTTKR